MLRPNKQTMGYRLMSEADYRLLREAYYGDGGFVTGYYLNRHRRERKEKFNDRRFIAYYLNYVAPVVNSHVGPIFAKPIARDWNGGGEMFDAFMSDIDREGSTMHHFMKSAALTSKLLGTVYIVVDNATGDEQPARRSDAITNRAFPYAYLVHPADVIDIQKDSHGGITRFEYYDGEGLAGERPTRAWTRDTWEYRGGDKTRIESHGLGVVPVVALHSRKTIRMVGISDGFIPAPSEFLSIAKANVRIYNLCSELDEIIRNQAFSILVYPAKDPKELTIGTDSAMGWDAEKVGSAAPHFIAPDPSPATIIMTQIDRLIKEIYRMAMLTHVAGVQEASSGVARAWDFERTNQALADFASNLEDAERKIVKLYNAWAKENVEYTCNYSNDFAINDTQQLIADTLNMLDMNLKANFQTAIKKRLARVVLANAPDAEHDAVIEELEREAQDARYGDSLENPSADRNKIDVGVASGIIDLLRSVQAGEVSPEAAKIVLVGVFGLSEEAADDAMDAQSEIAVVTQNEDMETPREDE